MYRAAKILGSILFPAAVLVMAQQQARFDGRAALEQTRRAVAFGPRPVNSDAHRKLQAYIKGELKLRGCQVMEDAFEADTPKGRIPMNNLICKFPGTSGKAVVFSGHFDTKTYHASEFPYRNFVGANDAGSSTGLLLEMARALSKQPRKHDVFLVFFDGEEALGAWTATDSLHGSRHLAARWQKEGQLQKILALVNVDMIGDKDLGIWQESNSSPQLRRQVWQIARDLGYSKHFLDSGGYIEDDHMPFVTRGVNSLDLIDFDYSPYWHTDRDTLDRLSSASFQVVGDVLLELLRRTEK